MDVDDLAIGGTIQNATRPRKSGISQNAHSFRQSTEPPPDYQKVLDVVEGKRGVDTEEKVPAGDEQQ